MVVSSSIGEDGSLSVVLAVAAGRRRPGRAVGGDGPSRVGACAVTATIGMAGVKGPAASTAALCGGRGVAVPGPTMLVEADPSGGSLLAGARICGRPATCTTWRWPASRAGSPSVAQRLGDMAVVPAWGRPFRLTQALSRPRVPWEVLFGEVGGTVIVDVGRLDPDGPTLGRVGGVGRRGAGGGVGAGPGGGDDGVGDRGGRHGAGDAGLPVERLRMVTTEVVGRRRRVSVHPARWRRCTGAAVPRPSAPRRRRRVDLLCRGARSPTGCCAAAARRVPRRPIAAAAGATRAGPSTPRREWCVMNVERIGTGRRPRPAGRADPPRVRRAAAGRAAARVAPRPRGPPGEDEVRAGERGDAADQRGAGPGRRPGADGLEEEDLVVELVLSAMFLLPHVLGILEREPLAEDLVVFGAGPGARRPRRRHVTAVPAAGVGRPRRWSG